MKDLIAYLLPSLTNFPSKHTKQKKEKSTSKQQFPVFSEAYNDTYSYPFNILNDSEYEKSRRVLVAKCQSLINKYGEGKKPQAAKAIDEDDEVEDALFEAGELSDSNPVGIIKPN